MDTFTLRVPWCPILRLFSRNPLMRTVDRIEAVLMLGAVVVSLLAAPLAAAVGTAVHDAHFHAEQAHPRQALTATVTDVHATGAQSAPPPEVITAPVWPVISRTAHTGAVKAAPTIYPSDRAGIWVDDNAQPVIEPTALSRAADDAVVAVLVIWVIVIAASAGLVALARVMLNRVRNAGWQYDIDNLLGRGGGQTNIQASRPRVARAINRRARGFHWRGAR